MMMTQPWFALSFYAIINLIQRYYVSPYYIRIFFFLFARAVNIFIESPIMCVSAWTVCGGLEKKVKICSGHLINMTALIPLYLQTLIHYVGGLRMRERKSESKVFASELCK